VELAARRLWKRRGLVAPREMLEEIKQVNQKARKGR
jgi:hypothetical protein